MTSGRSPVRPGEQVADAPDRPGAAEGRSNLFTVEERFPERMR
jgi:hypothetical protein